MNSQEEQAFREQLCQWMDGELHPDQSKFLMRRIAHDQELRMVYERWQLASTCLRRQPTARLPINFSERVCSALSSEVMPNTGKMTRWLIAGIASSLTVFFLFPKDFGHANRDSANSLAQSSISEQSSQMLTSTTLEPNQSSVTTAKPWPRSNTANSLQIDSTSLEAYLIRHNELATSSDSAGLTGFMPYVDVLSNQEVSDEITELEDRSQ